MIKILKFPRLKPIVSVFFVLATALPGGLHPAIANEPIKVGIFQNKPIVYHEGVPKGLYVDILNHVAEKENWQIEYVTCELKECLDLLKSNQLDLMTSLGVTPERSEWIAFSQVPVWTFWGTIYAKDTEITSILDLKDKKIGVRKKNNITRALKKILAEFNTPGTYVAFDNYDLAFEALRNDAIDAVAVNNTYAFDQYKDSALFHKTPIVFNPFSAYFGTPKNGGHPELLNTIDAYVKALKSDRSSLYHAFIQNWFGNTDTFWTIKKFGIAGGVLLLITIFGMALWRHKSVVRLNRQLMRNITDLEQADQAVRRLRRYSDNLVETSSAMIIELDRNGAIQLFSPSAERITGYTEKELQGRNLIKVLVPKDQFPHAWEEFPRLKAGGLPQVFENPILTKDGRQRHIAWSNSKIVHNGKVEGTLIFGTDITELKLATDALRKRERDHVEAQRISLLGHWDFDHANRTLNWSDEVFRIFEMAEHEFDGTVEAFLERVHPEDRDDVRRFFKACVEMQKSCDAVHRLLFADGRIKYVHQRGKHEYDEKGNLLRSIGTMQDVTLLKETEIEKQKIEKQLRHSQKLEAIGTLAGGIAHDFNNILSSIIGYAEIARIHEVPDENPAQLSLQQILKGAQRATDLVQQVLTFSRQDEQAFIPIDTLPLIKETAKMLRATLPTTIAINLDLKAASSTIMGESTRFHQILMNLCTNAAHAMRDHGGELKMQIRNIKIDDDAFDELPDLKPGRYLQLKVSDTGCGMLPEIRDRIFEPYFTTKPVGDGTGLGLAVVHGIIKEFRGHIRVSSEPGKGSMMSIWFPTVKPAIETDRYRPEPYPGGTERILFVDDEPPITALAHRLLAKMGYTVTVENSSTDALQRFKAAPQSFDLVITDMTMPALTGDQLARRILKIRPGQPIILCSGYSEAITSESVQAIGISAFVMKPLVPKELAHTIREVLYDNV